MSDCRTLSPLVVNNNIARGNINAELRLLGTVEQPGLTGRIDVEEGAELRLRERKYSVDRGVITFTNERAIEPILDILATTKVSDYNITMQISGDATRKIDTVLTSEPDELSEADIVSLLATGRTLEKAGGSRRRRSPRSRHSLTSQANWEPQSPTKPAAHSG